MYAEFIKWFAQTRLDRKVLAWSPGQWIDEASAAPSYCAGSQYASAIVIVFAIIG